MNPAYMIPRTRWIAEMQRKYYTDVADGEEFDCVGLTNAVDARRFTEILEEEQSSVANLEYKRPRIGSAARIPAGLLLVPDEAHGVPLSELLDTVAIARSQQILTVSGWS